MDSAMTMAWRDFSKFRDLHLNAESGESPFTLNFNASNYSWKETFTSLKGIETFRWKQGVTPLADLGIIAIAWVLYATTILSLRFLMRDQPPMKLKGLTALHNLVLCLWSAGMFMAGLIGAYSVYSERGMADVFWTQDPEKRVGLQYWAVYIFYFSKFYELLDTVILVLKKKPIIFLHWYHHAIVILMVWGWAQAEMGFAVVGLMFNTFVHVWMYYYYFASNIGWSVWYKKYITSLQIVQFIGSFMVMIPFMLYATREGANFESWQVIYLTWVVNGSFLVLFTRFYLNNYSAGSTKQRVAASKSHAVTVTPSIVLKSASISAHNKEE